MQITPACDGAACHAVARETGRLLYSRCPMARDKTVFSCTECGGTSPRWLGKCPACGAWNTLTESVPEAGAGKNRMSAASGPYAGLAQAQAVMPLAAIEATDVARTPSGIEELDRVLGGGVVEGGVVLIGGDPGIGKSTLLLQAMDALHRVGLPTLYVTGEESGAQVALRSRRLGLEASQVNVLAEIQLEKILATVEATQPAVCVIDSIQTIYSDQLTSAPGSVAQVRECAAHLTRMAKATGIAVILVGHVTKEGAPARACWSTWWTRCCTSRATRTAATAWCAPSRTASAR